MTRLATFLLAFLMFAVPAAATEYHPDSGMNTPASAMLDPASPNLWTVSGGKANGNGAKKMQMLMWMNSSIKQGHRYRVTFTVSGQTHGIVEASLGSTMTGASTGSYVSASGFTTIADTFTTANGLTTGGGTAADNLTGEVGAFRMQCSIGAVAPNDPLVYHNLPGRSHLHFGYGNTRALEPYADYSFYRTHGGTTCGEMASQSTPVTRQAYWHPAMLDGAGNVVLPLVVNLYYKQDQALGSRCTNPADPLYVPGAGGACIMTPQGLSWISGYNFADGTGSPGVVGTGHWECWGKGTYVDPGDGISQRSNNLSDFFHGGCAKRGEGGNAPGQGGVIGFFFIMANCWDGVYLDTPNHHDHVVYATRNNGSFYGGCPDDHPYRITSPQPQIFWLIDDNFVAGKWHLSSDEMVAGAMATPGLTMHQDFVNAWSPTVFQEFYDHCIKNGASCSSGSLGDNKLIKDGGKLASTGDDGEPTSIANGGVRTPQGRYFSTAKVGIGRPVTANGTYTQDITASANGRISLIAIEDAAGNGFDGQVDNMSVTDAP